MAKYDDCFKRQRKTMKGKEADYKIAFQENLKGTQF